MKKPPRIERPKRTKEDWVLEGMLDDTTRKACRPIVFNATGSTDADFAESEKSLADWQAKRNRDAADAKKKVRMC